ncbi:MAG: protein translocase subunit SecD [Proteobacteria bacterium]|nr:protein translocase subunit SecD [Pseudomonadota bacterium]
MKGTLRYRIVLALVVALLGLAWALPSFVDKDSALRTVLPDDEINLGLDLKGGVHLTLEVDVPKAVEYSLGQMGQDIKAGTLEEKIVVTKAAVLPGEKLQLFVVRQEMQEGFEAYLNEHYGSSLSIGLTEAQSDGTIRYVLAMSPDYRKNVERLTVDQAVKTMRNRIDQFGVAEPDIRKQQGSRIQVQLPGLDDPQRAIELIGRTAHLEFKLVDDAVTPAQARIKGREVLPHKILKADGTYRTESIVVYKEALLSGEYIANAGTNFNQFGQAYVTMTFNAAGGRKFARITGENEGRRLAIVLDGEVYSAPVIRAKIVGGSAQIEGNFSTEEAHDLAVTLRSGSLPAPVNILEERSVGPSLGQESIDKGIKSTLIGFALVLVFMALYYGFGGIVANLVLLLNIVLIMAGLAAFGATLTLPGIAGIILTIGMAVDANVIIFERIREELRRGLSRGQAIAEGYGRATLTIMDANVTTIIAAIILYQFGTGPIRGFAVTLTLGILASMFTAIFVSRILFDLFPGIKKPVSGLTIIRPDTKVDFIGRRKLAFVVSSLVILIGLGSLIVQGGPKYGVDFAGGITVQVKADHNVELDSLKTAMSGSGLDGVVVQRLGMDEDNEFLIRISETGLTTEMVRGKLQTALEQVPEGKFEIQRQEMVGPKVGADLREKALEAMFFAVLLIAIYISGRFEARWFTAGIMAAGLSTGVYLLGLAAVPMSVLIFAALGITLGLCWYLRLNYALGAVVALIHDVMITIGVFSLLGKEFDLTIVAALLTIIGYSLNDTIIVFDRIRENLHGKKRPSFKEIINISVNQTLSRTLLTSGTTLLVVLALFLFGGGVIHDFAFALLIGIVVGTYSSIFVASPILLGFGPSRVEEDKDEAPAVA